MAKNKVIVQDCEGNKRIVQPSMVPIGFKVVGDYKEPSKKDTAKKESIEKK